MRAVNLLVVHRHVYSCVSQQGKRKRSRPSTATNTPVKDCSDDATVKSSEPETNTEEETSEPAVVETCKAKPTEEQTTTDSSTAPAAAPQAAVKEKLSKSSKDRSDRKRERRRERKSESGSPAVPPADRASPICNGTAADDMNVCKYVKIFTLCTLVNISINTVQVAFVNCKNLSLLTLTRVE